MKVIIGASLALALLAGHALAQSEPPPPEAPPPAGDNGPMDARMPPADQAGGRDGGPMRPHRMGHFEPPPSKAARFHIETGEADIGIKCADDEPMMACADFTLQVLDKIAAMPRH